MSSEAVSQLSQSQPRRPGRSVLAIVVAIIGGIVVTLITDEIFHLVHVFPAWGASMVGYDGALALATTYRTVYGVLGSYVAASLAPRRPMWHAMMLGILGLVVSILGAVATWNGGPAFGPHWYPVVLVVLAIPTAWLGGKLRLMQPSTR